MRNFAKRAARIAGVLIALTLAALLCVWLVMIRMPGTTHSGPLPALSDQQSQTAVVLRRHVSTLADDIGERHGGVPASLARAANYMSAELSLPGLSTQRLAFDVAGQTFENIEASIAGTTHAADIIIVGAHYDSAIGTPAANDNGSGAATLLVLAQRFAGKAAPPRSIRFVAFANEEPPHFQTNAMGSLVYAKRCADAQDRVVAMLSLETMGYYRDAPGTQPYPPPLNTFYPDRGNFIGFIGDVSSRALVRQVVGLFREHTAFPSEGAALVAAIPGVGWSDHWSFWQVGYPAVMVTDTAVFRYPHYHTPQDTTDMVDFERLARVTDGLEKVVDGLATAP